ncbi:hypothetical protein PNEG_01405 [Pneumocystis murina B123]|uniref:Membrane insertase YidC/Oxa/ALB C-terminal domain-containing protein n=1 Tax=Pneumocystis murina (strain B123) TaxID=1069680 RepID=M7NS74_PNEMU|nr:hypothetical protein PNEG_01405 [Pneumocystis murina B123]EMR10127.1 hypothetical protein PNEG_01405 [Pneumocystis murina B123]
MLYRITYRPISRFFHVTSSRHDFLALACTGLQTVHALGIPWWATIPLTTLLLRTAMVPIVLWSRNRMIRYIYIKPLIRAWKCQIVRFDNIKSEKFNEKRSELFRRHNCHPIGSVVVPFIQFPLFLTMTFALRGMSGWSIPLFPKSDIPMEVSLSYEGIAWMQDLTVPDSIGFLPVCLGLINLINIELNIYFHKEMFFVSTFMTRFAQVNALIFIFISMQAPIALCLYWITSSLFSAAQNAVLNVIMPFPRSFMMRFKN